MENHLFAIAATVLDLLSLFTIIGALASGLWIVPGSPEFPSAPEVGAMRSRLDGMLGLGVLVLTASSGAQISLRAAGMSGLPLLKVFPVLPAVLAQTHYGRVWVVRALALGAIWPAWLLGRRRPGSRAFPACMLALCALIALTRSASGHGARAGDLSLSELADWAHLLSGALWGGTLIAVSTAVLPPVLAHAEKRPALLAGLSGRFSTLAGVALAGVLVTGTHNAVTQVGRLSALWASAYGNTLAVKLSFVLTMIALGATNRYLSVPRLQQWQGRPLTGGGPILRYVVIPLLSSVASRPPGPWVALRFRRKILAEVALLLGVLLCTGFLVQGVPPHHLVMPEGHGLMPGHGNAPVPLSHPTSPTSPARESDHRSVPN